MGSKKEYELAVKIAGMVDASLASSCALTKKQLKQIAKEAAAANASTVSVSEAMQKAAPGIDAAWSGLKTTVSAAVGAMAAAGAAVTAIGTASINVGKDFESAMSSWRGTADATDAEFQKARDAAMEMGRKTSKTAKESANALEYMALAGWSVEDSIAGLPGVLRLSEATGLDLARTSDLVTDSMSALGVEIGDLSGYLDIAAKANNKSNQTAEQLMEAYLGVGGMMKNLNVPLAESATALGVLANRGIKGSEAGNALNAVMINLTTGTGQAGTMMEKLGVSAFDSQGKFKGLKATLTDLNKVTSKLTEEERNAAFAAIGGKQHVDALNDLLTGLTTTVADGKTEWDSLNESLEHANGSLEKMAQTKMDNLEGDMYILTSALQDAGIQIYDGLTDPLREATQFATNCVYEFSGDIAAKLKETLPTARRELKQTGEAVMEFAKPLLMVGNWIAENPDVIGGGLAAAATTITAAKTAQTLLTTAQAVKTLGAALASNPVTAVGAAAAVAAGVVVGAAAKAKIANEKLKRENLGEHFGDMSLSLSELDDAAGRIIDNGHLEQLSTAMDEFDKVKDFADNISKSQGELDKLNWKIGAGFTLDESEYSSYKASLDQFIEDSIKLAEQQQYAMSINLDLLIGDDEEGDAIKEQFNSFYGELNGELQDLGKQLGDAYSEGMKDGVLSMDEVETIQALQSKMADITQKLSSSKFEASMEAISMKYEGSKLDSEAFQNLQDEIQTQVNEASDKLTESLEMNIQGAKLQFDEGAIDEAEYTKMTDKFKENYQKQLAEIEAQAGSFMTKSIMGGYQDEIDEATPQITEAINTAMETAFSDMGSDDRLAQMSGTYFSEILESGIKAANTEGLSEGSRAAIEQLLENMAPTIEKMEETKKKYEEAGKQVPESLAKALQDVESLQLLTGSADAIWSYTGQQIEGSEQYTATYNKAKEIGGTIPEQLSQGITDKKEAIESGIDSLWTYTKSYATAKFQTPMNIPVSISTNYAAKQPYTLPGHAEGGIFDEPHIGVLAEAGPEAYVPLDKSKRSLSIWQQAGQALGVWGGSSQSTQMDSNVTYNPTYNIYGADENTVRSATKDDQERFEMMLTRYMRDQRRLAF